VAPDADDVDFLELVEYVVRKLKNPNADAEGSDAAGTQFTCFSGTKVQMLTKKKIGSGSEHALQHAGGADAGEGYGCLEKQVKNYLIYWYKSANTDTEANSDARAKRAEVEALKDPEGGDIYI
jgi:hypothetical protein